MEKIRRITLSCKIDEWVGSLIEELLDERPNEYISKADFVEKVVMNRLEELGFVKDGKPVEKSDRPPHFFLSEETMEMLRELSERLEAKRLRSGSPPDSG